MTQNPTYQSYFGLSEAPFSIAPDPRYLYMSRRHQEALATLLFGINGNGGFVLLTGEVGAGKTTICRCLLEQMPETCDVAYIFNPKLTVVELLSTICDEFRITYPSGNTSIKLFVDLLNAYLLDAHARARRAVLIIDEAQNLSADVLEQLRLLTNLETHERKLLQIILLGQPELATMLRRPELSQLAQRVVARYHLGPLTKAEVESYVRHRLEVSGAQRQLVPISLMGKVYSLSSGVPRVINLLCDRALLGVYVQGKDRVDRTTLAQAAREVLHHGVEPRRNTTLILLACLIAAAGAFVANRYQPGLQDSAVFPAQETPARPAAAAAPLISTSRAIGTGSIAESGRSAVLPAKLEWPANVPRSASRALANSALMQRWGIDFRAGADMCTQAASAGLNCWTARSGLDELRQLNRPAILQMHDDRGEEFQAVLTGLDERSASFAIGNETRVVDLGALANQWSGSYTLLWRLHPDISRDIRPGEVSSSAEWLRKQLAMVRGEGGEAANDPTFDAGLSRQLKQFQLAHGLVPDGVAGLRTLMRLTGATDQAAPKLFTTQTER